MNQKTKIKSMKEVLSKFDGYKEFMQKPEHINDEKRAVKQLWHIAGKYPKLWPLFLKSNCKGYEVSQCSVICKMSKLSSYRFDKEDFHYIVNYIYKNNPVEINTRCFGCGRLPIRKFLLYAHLDEENLAVLLKNGFDVNAVYNFRGDSILMLIAKNLRLKLFECLLGFGVDVYAKNKQNEDVFEIILGKIYKLKSRILKPFNSGYDKTTQNVYRKHKSILKSMLFMLKCYVQKYTWRLLLAARYKNPDSPFYGDVFPLDLFKLIFELLKLNN